MAKKTDVSKPVENSVVISAPNFKTIEFKIEGTAPFVQLKFSKKGEILEGMADPAKAKKTKRSARDYQKEFIDAMYEGEKGLRGIPAMAFRCAMISACRTVGFKMTLAKLSLFVESDGFDKSDGIPLVKIEGKPELCQHACRNANGSTDIRTRAMWKTWSAKVRVRYDADQFSQNDVANLMMRVGMQVGIGEGRPDGRQSGGMGWGLFKLV